MSIRYEVQSIPAPVTESGSTVLEIQEVTWKAAVPSIQNFASEIDRVLSTVERGAPLLRSAKHAALAKKAARTIQRRKLSAKWADEVASDLAEGKD